MSRIFNLFFFRSLTVGPERNKTPKMSKTATGFRMRSFMTFSLSFYVLKTKKPTQLLEWGKYTMGVDWSQTGWTVYEQIRTDFKNASS